MQHLSAYLPADRCVALLRDEPMPDRTSGAALFADISGFTPLTATLARDLGPRRGAEELMRQLNRIYDALTTEVDRFGGVVIGFSGDAITCWFDAAWSAQPALQATACALAMQQALQQAALGMKIAIATGPARRFVVGNPEIQLMDVLAGETLARMAAAERVAGRGEVLVDGPTVERLAGRVVIEAWRADEAGKHRYAVVSGLQGPVDALSRRFLGLERLSDGQLRPWLPATIYARLREGQGQFLAELRPSVALFLHFTGIDYDQDDGAGARLDSYIRWVQRIVTHYEGMLLNVTMGDKGSYLYIAFGASIAHEDDARRAVTAALALKSVPAALDFIHSVKIGISQGIMRTGAYGGTTRRTYGVIGDEVNVAARLMEHAGPGEILVSGRVRHRAGNRFAWKSLAMIQMKGKNESVPVWALLPAAQPRGLAFQGTSNDLVIIGREREMALVEEKLRLALAGRGQIVGIVAEAGMGKSRLVAELLQRAEEAGFSSYGSECHSYGSTTPYLPWQSIWAALFGLSAGASVEAQQGELERALAKLQPVLAVRLPLLAPLLNLTLPDNALTRSFDPEHRKRSLESLLVECLAARSQERPLLLVLEDLHWMDDLSLDLLEVLGRALARLPVLLLLSYRPPEPGHWGEPRVARLSHFTRIALAEFTFEEAERLIKAKLTRFYPQEVRRVPEEVIQQLASRGQGNPFYIEELLNYLHRRGVNLYENGVTLATIDLPDSLHRLILSRIDQLSEHQKVILKVASVMGRLFRVSWLCGCHPALGAAAEVEQELESLAALALIRVEAREPALVYQFKHAAIRDVAYESMAYATRLALHEHFASYLEQQVGLEGGASLDLLAYHYAHSDNQPKKIEFLRRAGEAAQAAYANLTALDYYQQLLPCLEEQAQVEILLKMGSVLDVIGQWRGAEDAYRRALHLLHQRCPGDSRPAAEARCQQILGTFFFFRWRYQEALGCLEQARLGYSMLDDQVGLGRALDMLGAVRLWQGEYELAQALCEEGLALRRTIEDAMGIGYSLLNLGAIAYFRDKLTIAAHCYQESLARFQGLGEKRAIARLRRYMFKLPYEQGRYDAARAIAEESVALAREIGDKRCLAIALGYLGLALIALGEPEAGWAALEEGVALAREMEDPWILVEVLGSLGLGAYALARYASAEAALLESLSLLREQVTVQWYIARALVYAGLVAAVQGRSLIAQHHYQESLELSMALNSRSGIANSLLGLTALHFQQEPERAVQLLAGAMAQLQNTDAPLLHELRPARAHILEEAPVLLGQTHFERAWVAGEALTVAQLVALALRTNGND